MKYSSLLLKTSHWLIGALIFALTSTYSVADQTPADSAGPLKTMAQLLEQIRVGRIDEQRINQAREATFLAKRQQQSALLTELEQQINSANALSAKLEQDFNQNESSLAQQQQRLKERLGDFGELFGVVRQVAADTGAQLEQSMVSAQLPARAQMLNQMAKNRELPTITDIEKLWFTLTEEMREQGRVVSFTAPVVNPQGVESNRVVTRIGPFVSFTEEGQFLNYLSSTRQLAELPRQPRALYRTAAENLSTSSGDFSGSADPQNGYAIAPIDPSSGAILSLLIQRPDMAERIRHGGIIGYIVIFVGLIGLLLGIERIVTLSITSFRINRQIQNPQTIGINPLGRIFAAFNGTHHDNTSRNIDSLELKLDDLILKETPRIRRGLSTLKVLAGVAPLLGLLGTVTGMVETFDVITLFGSGDARLMAGGISQALVTTALGLTAAIPILLLHSVANSHSRNIVERLEEQTAGLLAQYSQKDLSDD